MNKVDLTDFHYTENNIEPLNKNNKLLLFFLFFVIVSIISVVLIISVLNGGEKKDIQSQLPEISNENAYFVPPSNADMKLSLRGKILNSVPINVNGIEVSHKLVNDNDDIVAYLYSDINDLNLSTGFDVEVEGVTEKDQYNGVKIIKVESIRLK